MQNFCQSKFRLDPIHLENRFRTRLFKPSIMPMGNYTASSSDIVTMTKCCTKEKYLLNNHDLTLKDKMNFATTIKLCNPRMWKLLSKHMPGVHLLIYLFK